MDSLTHHDETDKQSENGRLHTESAASQSEKAHRRRWTKEYKRRILAEADELPEGELGALLRREGLYKSQLSKWRRQRALGRLDVKPPKDIVDRLMDLERENRRLQRKLAQAEAVITLQKKLSALLGLTESSERSG